MPRNHIHDSKTNYAPAPNAGYVPSTIEDRMVATSESVSDSEIRLRCFLRSKCRTNKTTM